MVTANTQTQTGLGPDPRNKARVLTAPITPMIHSWLQRGYRDFRNNIIASGAYGLALVIISWLVLYLLGVSGLGWMILPVIAGTMMLGPLATVGLYRMSRRAQGMGGAGIASPGQLSLLGVVMMVLALLWIRAATLLFAVFFGLRPFAGFLETLPTLFQSGEGVALVLSGTLIGGLFAAFSFAISVFSFPMLLQREIDAFSAMGLSFNATTQNLKLMVSWAAVVTALVLICLLTGLLAAIVIFPILGHATWHAYSDLFEETHHDD
ncbi:putative integral membrane protein [Cognatishimia activa]|uniref:Putative integral membrane protein n=1 Tax=Cognatishimia activa TaxID=1715691 RepID=A0A0P1J3E5_9RHOB|nr:DUF2189 domain-containing protein [Cognatishimia activa]CUK27513.1 putative integral membrane protein [Cognatishimia activa]